MRNALVVGLGGCLGSIARYLTSVLIHRLFNQPSFPYATLVVNVSGCLLIGLLGGLAEQNRLLRPGMRLFLVVGLLGGFTTFSAFSYETLTLADNGKLLPALLNISAHIILGLSAVWLGATVAKNM